MAQALDADRQESNGSGATDERVVLLGDARTPTERRLIAEWAERAHPGAPLLDHREPLLAERLEAFGDPEVVPVRVTWLPRERDGDRRVRLSDLVALRDPHRPPARAQERIAEREPDRVHVVAAEGATVSALRARFREQSGTLGTPSAFSAFVRRQALIASDRADRAIIGDRYKVPRLVAEQITASAEFRAEIDKLAEQEGRPAEQVMGEAVSALRELATVQSPVAIDAFRLLLSPMHARAYDVQVDLDGLERLRELNRRHALVFLPTHRSYADPLVLAEVLHDNNFPRNHLLGGNNLAFWPIGPLGKRAGVVFIRRSFGDDRVYKLAVREFLGYLVAKRFNIEWYLEGGRTRTGKLRPPKYGLLHYLAAAVDKHRAEDVMLVPVSINYSRLHEVSKMAEEQGGKKKKAEGLGWLAGYMRAQARRIGSVRIDFGEAISLRAALDDAGEDGPRLEKVAFRICDGINRITPVSAPSLVTFALLGTPRRALTLDQVRRILAPVIDYCARRQLPGDVEPLRSATRLRGALDELVVAGVVSVYDGGTEPVWQIAPGNHMVAAFYRNGVIHHFMDRAIVELGLLHAARHEAQEPDLVQSAWEYALTVRDLLKFEFFFADKTRFREELRAELDLIDPDWAQRSATPEGATELLRGSGLLVANRTLRSFLDAQLVLAELLAKRDPREPVDRDAFVKECLGVGRQMLLQGRMHSAESLSQELFNAALQLAANRDLLDPGRELVRSARRSYYDEVLEVVGLVDEIRALDEEIVEEVLDAARP
ncbi:MAG TPA: glycerol-3-phosphate 1-O-acyltransferase [Solirubrobacteraceae bacterium]|nr:glycerol-3-phosphate 1-O-acyltransferase [Solirubrobacteraceae bacterium]